MSSLFRTMLALIAGTLAVTSTAVTASASGTGPVRVNTTSTIATAGLISLDFLTGSGVLTSSCGSLTFGQSITSSGAVAVTPRTAAFTACSVAISPMTVTQPLAWSGTIRHLDAVAGTVRAITYDITIPAGGIAVSALGCTFTLSGTLLGDYVLPSPIVHNTLFNNFYADIPGTLVLRRLTLTVANVAGTCALLGLANGQQAQLRGSFTFAGGIQLAAL